MGCLANRYLKITYVSMRGYEQSQWASFSCFFFLLLNFQVGKLAASDAEWDIVSAKNGHNVISLCLKMADIISLGGVFCFWTFRPAGGPYTSRLDAEVGCFGVFDEAITDYDYLYNHTMAYCNQTGGFISGIFCFLKQFTNLTSTIFKCYSRNVSISHFNIKIFTHTL